MARTKSTARKTSVKDLTKQLIAKLQEDSDLTDVEMVENEQTDSSAEASNEEEEENETVEENDEKSDDGDGDDDKLILNSDGEVATAGTVCEVRNLYQTPPDKHGKVSWTKKYPEDLDEPVEDAQSAQYALLVRNRKCYDGTKKLEIESIIVQSELLKDALGEVFKDYPGMITNLDRLELRAPFQPFVHRWERFAEYRARDLEPEMKAHVDLLWTILEEELRSVIREKKDHMAKGVTSFRSFWAICEPGCWIYSNQEEREVLMKLSSTSYGSTQCGEFFYLHCKYIDWDGEGFGRSNSRLDVPAFEGTRKVNHNVAFPLEFHPDKEGVIARLTQRGKKFASLKGYHFKHYEGVALGPTFCGFTRYNVKSRVIIDTEAFNRFNPNRKVRVERSSGKYRDRPRTNELPLCHWMLHGYSLKDKKWLDLAVDDVKEIEWDEDAFKSLVAPADQKELVLAFAESQAKSKNAFDDVIKGKGRGIIMLLCGPPGVGKTLTAESVAEAMKVPLYTMSAGDLGTEPSDVEDALSNILEMNQKWNAVLLLDEADVFLEARSSHDLERNKLVSIFLRMLEYYEGILFLTTNRVENMDAAFESRIHLTLQYDELDLPRRIHVWKTFLLRGNHAERFTDEQIERLAQPEMNGRQIKNILKTSQLLASRKDEKLNYDHIQTVLNLRQANGRKRKVTNSF